MTSSEIEPEQQSYLEALEAVESSAKFSVGATVAPLAIIATQIRSIFLIDSITIKIPITLLILLFAYAAYASVIYLVMLRVLLAKERLLSRGVASKGQKTLTFFEQEIMKGRAEIDEDLLLSITKSYSLPAGKAIAAGWILLLVTLLVAVWS